MYLVLFLSFPCCTIQPTIQPRDLYHPPLPSTCAPILINRQVLWCPQGTTQFLIASKFCALQLLIMQFSNINITLLHSNYLPSILLSRHDLSYLKLNFLLQRMLLSPFQVNKINRYKVYNG